MSFAQRDVVSLAPERDAPGEEVRCRVLIVDDHEVVHWGIRVLLAKESWASRCIGVRATRQALELAERYRPNIALVDLVLHEPLALDLCLQLRSILPNIRIVLMTATGRVDPGIAMSVRAAGYIAKDWPAADVVRTIRAIGMGVRPVAPVAARQADEISCREREVLVLAAAGATNREIAAYLHLSTHTVKDHLGSLYRKLDARNRTTAVHRARLRGLIA